MSIADLRTRVSRPFPHRGGRRRRPDDQFKQWFEEAQRAELLDANAMTLATVSATGAASARTVLLKGVDDHGFVFFTNYESAKAAELATNPRACLLFFWAELERQVRITGAVSRGRAASQRAYFAPVRARARSARGRRRRAAHSEARLLEENYERSRREYDGNDVPEPPFWGGYRVAPSSDRVLAGPAQPPARSAALSTHARRMDKGATCAVERYAGRRHLDRVIDCRVIDRRSPELSIG